MPRLTTQQGALKLLDSELQTVEEYLLQEYALDDSDNEGSYEDDVDQDSASNDALFGDTDTELFFLSVQDELKHVRTT